MTQTINISFRNNVINRHSIKFDLFVGRGEGYDGSIPWTAMAIRFDVNSNKLDVSEFTRDGNRYARYFPITTNAEYYSGVAMIDLEGFSQVPKTGYTGFKITVWRDPAKHDFPPHEMIKIATIVLPLLSPAEKPIITIRATPDLRGSSWTSSKSEFAEDKYPIEVK